MNNLEKKVLITVITVGFFLQRTSTHCVNTVWYASLTLCFMISGCGGNSFAAAFSIHSFENLLFKTGFKVWSLGYLGPPMAFNVWSIFSYFFLLGYHQSRYCYTTLVNNFHAILRLLELMNFHFFERPLLMLIVICINWQQST